MREARMAAVRPAVNGVRIRSAVIRTRIAREDAEVSQLERDIAATEVNLASLRAGLARLCRKIEQDRRELDDLGA